jgi:hypothetical protein
MTDGYGTKKSKEPLPIATLEDQRKWTQLVKRAWIDETLKQQLLNDPAPLLREHGIAIPTGANVRVVQDKDTVACIVESVKSADDLAELTTSDLSGVVGGKAASDKPVQLYLVFKLRQVVISS